MRLTILFILIVAQFFTSIKLFIEYKNKKLRLKRNYFILILNAVLWFLILTIVVYFFTNYIYNIMY